MTNIGQISAKSIYGKIHFLCDAQKKGKVVTLLIVIVACIFILSSYFCSRALLSEYLAC